MKQHGSKTTLGVLGDTGYKAMFSMAHLPTSNIVQRRRRSMCQQINTSMEQLVQSAITPFYPIVFPQGLDYFTGGYQYADSIPPWWYRLAASNPPSILSFVIWSEMMPVEAEMVLLSMLSTPTQYVQASRGTYKTASECWWQVVTDLHMQELNPARRIVWWGWHLTTKGPAPSPSRVFDPNYDQDGLMLAESRRFTNWDEDEFEVETHELLSLNLPTEVQTMRALGYESDEWVFWRAAQLALDAGIRDAEELGWPHPVGIRGSPAGFRLIFDENSDGFNSDTTLSQNGSVLSEG